MRSSSQKDIMSSTNRTNRRGARGISNDFFEQIQNRQLFHNQVLNRGIFDLDIDNDYEENDNTTINNKLLIKKIKKQKIGKTSKTCAICFNNFEKEEIIRVLHCNHFFHNKCIKQWLFDNWNCPICRLDLKELLDDSEDN